MSLAEHATKGHEIKELVDGRGGDLVNRTRVCLLDYTLFQTSG